MTTGGSEWAHGWRTVASGTLGMAVMTGVSSVTGVVMEPLNEAFGWSRAVVATNVFLCSAMALLLAPAAGALIARYGVRKVAIMSVVAAVPGLLLIAATGGSPLTWYAAWTLFAILNVGIGPMVWSMAVSGLFEKSRGIALAVTLSGGGLAFFLFPPIAVFTEAQFGWRAVYIGIALIFLLIMLPIMLRYFKASVDLPPVRAASHSASGHGPALSLEGISLQEAMRTRRFWQLAALAIVVAVIEGILMVHLFPILKEEGLTASTAAAIASAMGLALIVGRLITGLLLDRMQATHVFAVAILLLLMSCLCARAIAGNVVMGTLVAVLLGLGSGGTSSTLAYMTGRYFGLRAYASIFGILMGVFALGYGTAPALAGHVRDVLDSYTPMFSYLGIAAGVAMVLALTLGRVALPRPQASVSVLREA